MTKRPPPRMHSKPGAGTGSPGTSRQPTPLTSPRDLKRDSDYESTTTFEGIADEARKRKLTYAKITIGITMREGGTCKVEESVYGAAIVMPQIARTVGWDRTTTVMAVRTYLFLFLSIFLQAYLLQMLAKEENVMDLFAGQMNLCDFGAQVDACVGPGCTGPGGTHITPSRMYDWDAIVNRNFVKDSFKALFPDQADAINDKIDPGEYGVESYWCRTICCFVFMISCMQELIVIIKIIELLYQIPTAGEPWIVPKESLPTLGGFDEVTLQIAGMPMMWKILNTVFVVTPKLLLWKLTAETGMTFLMETSGIQAVIVNSVALGFVVTLAELIMQALMSEETRDIVVGTADFQLWDAKTSCVGDMGLLSDDEILEKHATSQSLRSWGCKDLIDITPWKLVFAFVLTLLFIVEYYFKYCTSNKEDPMHRMVSKDMYTPKSTAVTWYQALFPFFFRLEYEDKPFWTMPY